MKTINLINIDKSEVKYELSIFPDGEPHIKLEEISRKDEYRVVSRISSMNDLFVLMQVGDILNRQGVEFDLVITYLMSQRMDRVITFEEAFSLDIVAKMINTLEASSVYIVEAHSDRAFKLIKNSKPYTQLVFTGIVDQLEHDLHTNVCTCYPDHGAFSRYGSVGEDCIIMNKRRDLNNKGAILSIDIESTPSIDPDVIIIRDDLCDAGGTFCWAAKILKVKYPNVKLYISVIHMVNPIGIQKLCSEFDGVHITNSYKDWDENEHKNLVVHKLF